MRVSYGSNWKQSKWTNVVTQRPTALGGRREVPKKVVPAFNERYPGPAEFREICAEAATTSYRKNKYRGFEFFDHLTARRCAGTQWLEMMIIS